MLESVSQTLEAERAAAASSEELLHAQVKRAQEEALTYHRRLSMIYGSPIWKLGWLLYGLLRALRHPRWAAGRIRRRRVRRALIEATPAEKAARMPRVVGEYELAAPKKKTTVAVKVTDMLGEEVLETRQL